VAYLVFRGGGGAAGGGVATILAPTDAALGLAVVTNKAVPVRIRRALNVESGLNDGIATPFVTLFVAAVAAEEALGDTAWGWEAVKQVGLAIVAAVVVGYLGGWLLSVAVARGWTSDVSEQIAILAMALLAYEGSVAIGGNGFIAAFVGGLLFGAATRGRLRAPVQFTETLGLAASFLVWSLFGALFVGALLTQDFALRPIVYAVLSLTVIRMVPVAIALFGTRLRPATVAFMGWFGPRGLASVVFLLIALEEIEHAGDGSLLVAAVTWTILLSVVAHGVSASGLAAAYGRSIRRAGEVAETMPAGEPPIRVRDLAGRHHHQPSSSHSSASKP
jgi:NhaP-type Na+/H+ or K+/H+ antiporter